MIKKYSDLSSSLVFLLLAISMFIISFNFEALTISKIGPSFFPRIIGIVMAVLSFSLMLNAIRKIEPGKPAKTQFHKYKKPIISFIMLIVYVSLLKIIGFLILTMVYLFIQMAFLTGAKEKKKILLYGVISISTSYVIYYLFRNVLNLLLPTGIL